jgi:hypothetical protein
VREIFRRKSVAAIQQQRIAYRLLPLTPYSAIFCLQVFMAQYFGGQISISAARKFNGIKDLQELNI